MSGQEDIILLVDIKKEQCGLSDRLKKYPASISNDEEDRYYLYEFSDKYRLISDSPIYPNLFNYLKTGLLTEEELLEALLK